MLTDKTLKAKYFRLPTERHSYSAEWLAMALKLKKSFVLTSKHTSLATNIVF